MFVCMFVCFFVCMYVCVYTCKCVHVYQKEINIKSKLESPPSLLGGNTKHWAASHSVSSVNTKTVLITSRKKGQDRRVSGGGGGTRQEAGREAADQRIISPPDTPPPPLPCRRNTNETTNL